MKKQFNQEEEKENDRPILGTISGLTIRREFDRTSGLTDRNNIMAHKPYNMEAHNSKLNTETNFSEWFKFLKGFNLILYQVCFFRNLTQKRPKSIEAVPDQINELTTWPELDQKLCSAIIQPFFKLLYHDKVRELLMYDRCW